MLFLHPVGNDKASLKQETAHDSGQAGAVTKSVREGVEQYSRVPGQNGVSQT